MKELNQIAKSVEALLDDSLYDSSEIKEKNDGVVIHLEGIEDQHRKIDTTLQHIRDICVVEVYPLFNDDRAEVKIEDRERWILAEDIED